MSGDDDRDARMGGTDSEAQVNQPNINPCKSVVFTERFSCRRIMESLAAMPHLRYSEFLQPYFHADNLSPIRSRALGAQVSGRVSVRQKLSPNSIGSRPSETENIAYLQRLVFHWGDQGLVV